MPVTKRWQAAGDFDIELDRDIIPVPFEVTNKVDIDTFGYGHVVIVPTRVAAADHTASTLLGLSVYTGVYRVQEERTRLSGSHATIWIGDEQGKGPEEYPLFTFARAAGTFTQWVGDFTPQTLYSGGTVGALAGTLDWVGKYSSNRDCLDYVCGYFGAEWQVTDTLKLNANTAAALYGTVPTVIATPWWDGRDVELVGLRTKFVVVKDVEDYSTGVIVTDDAGTAFIARVTSTPYKDVKGNALIMSRFVDGGSIAKAGTNQSQTLAAAERGKTDHVAHRYTLSSDAYCPLADAVVGSNMYVYDPDRGLVNFAYEAHYGGWICWPIVQRIRSITMMIREGMGVYFLDGNGVITDLSDWVRWESGESTIEVGDPVHSPADAFRLRGFGR